MEIEDMFVYAGKTALVTGASSGIGAEFARQLAARGSHLVLVARSRSKLEALASELTDCHGVRADVLVDDLGSQGAAQRLAGEATARGLRVDVLINNAGFGTHGLFHTLSADREREEIAVNVAALVDLAHAFVPGMVERGEGAVINVASTAAFQPDPYMAVYGATKAFVLSFSHALRAETRARGVRVTVLCPGATETAFFDVVGSPHARVGRPADPRSVVAAGLRAVEQDRAQVVTGVANTALALGPRFIPRALAARIAARLLRPPAAEEPAPMRGHADMLTRYRLGRAYQRFVANRLWGTLLRLGIAPAVWALLETTGRRTGRLRHTPVGNGLDASGTTFWLIAQYGLRTNYVRNLLADPRVRVKVRGRWRTGRARVLLDDDARARQASMPRFNAAAVRLFGTELLTVRIDLDPA